MTTPGVYDEHVYVSFYFRVRVEGLGNVWEKSRTGSAMRGPRRSGSRVGSHRSLMTGNKASSRTTALLYDIRMMLSFSIAAASTPLLTVSESVQHGSALSPFMIGTAVDILHHRVRRTLASCDPPQAALSPAGGTKARDMLGIPLTVAEWDATALLIAWGLWLLRLPTPFAVDRLFSSDKVLSKECLRKCWRLQLAVQPQSQLILKVGGFGNVADRFVAWIFAASQSRILRIAVGARASEF